MFLAVFFNVLDDFDYGSSFYLEFCFVRAARSVPARVILLLPSAVRTLIVSLRCYTTRDDIDGTNI